MIKYILIIFVSLGISIPSLAQSSGVGINTNNPQATLDVNGSVEVREKMYLENPGSFQYQAGANLLIQREDISLVKYDITKSKYGPINYIEYVFNNIGNDLGLQDYNTKIDADLYFVSVQGYNFSATGKSRASLLRSKGNNRRYVEGYQIYSYKKLDPDTLKETWWIKAIVNNSRFYTYNPGSGWWFPKPSIDPNNTDLRLNVFVYRNDFITKGHSPIRVDMNNSDSATAPLPVEFQ